MRDTIKVWKLELSSAELSILQVALDKFAAKYEGDVFTFQEIESTKDELNSYKYIPQFTSNQSI